MHLVQSRALRSSFIPWLVVALSIALGRPSRADLPDFTWYQVNLGPPPQTAWDALQTVPQRSARVVAFNACGREIEFLAQALDAEGDIAPFLIAKVAWMGKHASGSCQQKVTLFDESVHHLDHGFLHPNPATRVKAVNELMKDRYGPGCGAVLKKVDIRTVEYDGAGRTAFDLSFEVNRNCMVEQINRVINPPPDSPFPRRAAGRPGTSGLPCRLFQNAGKGDWDMAVTGYLRAYYLNLEAEQLPDDPPLLQSSQDYIFNNLLTLSGALEDESYPLTGCGNSEMDLGNPQERADEFEADEKDFWDYVGDFFDWLLNLLTTPFKIAAAWALFVTGAWAWAPEVLETVVTEAAAPILEHIHIPETENHLLMINTSKYLTNQIMMGVLTDKDDRERLAGYQVEVKEWLLKRLQSIAQEDFIEYNARPYQRLSINAILNLHDFARDRELRTASQIVLEYAAAKFAVGSNQGRRIVPFRRLMEVVRNDVCTPGGGTFPCPANASVEGAKPVRMFDNFSGADHQIAAGLFYAGQSQQLPEATGAGVAPGSRLASVHAAGEMVWEATSDFVPQQITLALGIQKSPYDQRFHHAGWEVYSNGTGFLVSGGGVQTKFAYKMLLGPIEMYPPFYFREKNADRGAGVPTLLIPAGGSRQVRRTDFLRIEGRFSEWEHDEQGMKNLTNDHNLCVWKGFACGTNFRVPPAIEPCLTSPPIAAEGWMFIDSTTCPAYQGAPPFYVALFRLPCRADAENCYNDWGFFEAVDQPGVTFDEFMHKTVEKNPPFLTAAARLTVPSTLAGTYVSWRGERIAFDVDAHAEDDDRSGIDSVDGISQPDIDDWPLATGDAVSAAEDGRIVIRWPGHPGAGEIRMDFTDWGHPRFERVSP